MVTKAQRKHLDEVTRLIPGYDSWETAEDCTFDYEEAQRALDFFPECLVHVKGEWAGQPLVLEDWQQGPIANLFGWKRPDGTRRYRYMMLYVPRKNAKTTVAAGVALYLLCCDNEPGAEIYSAAANEDQAGICFATAKGMVRGCEELSAMCEIYKMSLTFKEYNSYVVLTSKAATKHGLNPHGVILDELHAHKDRELADTMTTAVGSRRQPLILYTTTADYGRPSLCNVTYHYACQVRDGVIADKAFLPVIYEASIDDDWTSEAVWRKANPNYGISVKIDFIKDACKKAENSPELENSFKRLHLNIITEQAMRWLKLNQWDSCAGEVDWKKLRELVKGRPCFAGLDLASTIDLAALVLSFPMDGTTAEDGTVTPGPIIQLPYFWVPRDTAIQREKRDRVPYLTWAQQGALNMTDGNVIDYDVIRRDVNKLGEIYNIKEIAMDRWASAQISNQLTQDGFEVVGFGQGYQSMSAPTKELEKFIRGSRLRHGGHPVLRWNASNVAVEKDAADNVKPSKKKSPEKIDGIVASIMSIGSFLAAPLKNKSVYSSRGIVAL